MNKKKEEEIESVKMNTHNLQKNIAVSNDYRKKTDSLRCSLSELYLDCLSLYNSEYTVLSENQKYQLGTLVNNANSLSALVKHTLYEVA